MNKKYLAVSLLLLFFLLQSLYTLLHNNLIIDEPSYIAVGYYFVKYANTHMVILHPPLAFLLAGFPLLFTKINLPHTYEECTKIGYYQCSQDLFFSSNNDAEKIGVNARLPFLVFSLILGLALFRFTEEMHGTKAGLFALVLYAFSPTILGYNTIVFTDLLVAFFVFSAMYAFWKLMKNYSRFKLILAGISFGLALASKFTAIFLIPIFAILSIIRASGNKKNRKTLLRRYLIRLLWIFIIGIAVLYSTYLFSFGTIADSIPQRYSRNIQSAIGNNFDKSSIGYKISDYIVHNLKMPMPQYFTGLAGQYQIESTKGKEGYVNGKIYDGGKWYYFFEVLLIKTPVPLLIFFIVSLAFLFKRKSFSNGLFLLLPILFFIGPFIATNFNLGLRHILPIVPFMFMLSSTVIEIKFNKDWNIVFKFLVIVLLLWYATSALLAMPHYASYFNELAGGPKNGHKYLLSSNLDMGQDLKELKKYLEANGINKIKLSYHGAFDPSYYNISYEPLPMETYIPWAPGFAEEGKSKGYKEDCSKKYGIIVISVSNLHNYHLTDHSCFNWLYNYKPIKDIGNTIYVYNITN